MSTSVLAELEQHTPLGQHAVPCHACGSRRLSILLSPADLEAEGAWLRAFHAERSFQRDEAKDRSDFTNSEPTYLVQCDSCGTLLRDPQPTCAALAESYARDHYGIAALTQLAANQAEFFAGKRHELQSLLPPGSRVLEVGSFTGGFLRAARHLGWEATGLDIGEETYRFQREQGLSVLRSDVCSSDLPPRAFAGVFIWNTFDQLCNPGEVLDCARRLLAPDGWLVLRIPNGRFEIECLRARRRQPGTPRETLALQAQAYNNFLTMPYLTAYTPRGIGELLRRHGFAVQRMIGDTLLPLADSTTKPWARREEEQCKRLVRRLCRAKEVRTGKLCYPWLDIYAHSNAE